MNFRLRISDYIKSRCIHRLKYCLCLIGRPFRLSFIILGGQKCGSTSLATYLSNHPSCGMAAGKEPRLFTAYYQPEQLHQNVIKAFNRRDLRFFSGQYFEATTEYSYIDVVPERLYQYNPDLKLILLVRDPVSRAFSEYQMNYNDVSKGRGCWEDPTGEYWDRLKDSDQYPFSWFVEEELRRIKETGSTSSSAFQYPDFIRRGLYSEQLTRYYRYFKPEQILIIEDKELRNQKRETLRRVESFLGISHIEYSDENLENRNIGAYRFTLPDDCRKQLKDYFAPYNEAFFQLIGKRMDW